MSVLWPNNIRWGNEGTDSETLAPIYSYNVLLCLKEEQGMMPDAKRYKKPRKMKSQRLSGSYIKNQRQD